MRIQPTLGGLVDEVVSLYRDIYESRRIMNKDVAILSEPWDLWFCKDHCGILWGYSPFKNLRQYHLKNWNRPWMMKPSSFSASLNKAISKARGNEIEQLRKVLGYYQQYFEVVKEKYLPHIMMVDQGIDVLREQSGILDRIIRKFERALQTTMLHVDLSYYPPPMIWVDSSTIPGDQIIELRGGSNIFITSAFLFPNISFRPDPEFLCTCFEICLACWDVVKHLARVKGLEEMINP